MLVARNLTRLNQVAGELQARHRIQTRVLVKDLSSATAPPEIFDALRDTPISILVNNAGFGRYGPFARDDLARLTDLMQVNMTALVQLTHLFLQPMLARGRGRILNVASTAAFQPGPMVNLYYASKAFVYSFSYALANELEGTGVTVTALCPGTTRTEFFDRAHMHMAAGLAVHGSAPGRGHRLSGFDARPSRRDPGNSQSDCIGLRQTRSGPLDHGDGQADASAGKTGALGEVLWRRRAEVQFGAARLPTSRLAGTLAPPTSVKPTHHPPAPLLDRVRRVVTLALHSMRLLCAMVAVGILAGQAVEGRAEIELADGIKAIVHDSIITFLQVENRTAPVRDELRRRYGDQPEVFLKKLGETLDENLEVLLENNLILHEFEAADKYRFPESVIDDQMQTYIRSTYGDNRVRFIKTLQAEGKTYEDFRKEFRNHLIIQQLRYLHGAGEIIVSPHKIEVYYVEHKDQFKVESEVKLRMIVLNKPAGDTNETRQLAGEILAKINEGAAFAEMASVNSQGSQRSQGGDWGWVEKSVLRKELADVAFALKPGEHSGVIETPEACYLMRVEDNRPERIQPLSDVRARIEALLLGEEANRLQKQWIERLKKKTFVRYF